METSAYAADQEPSMIDNTEGQHMFAQYSRWANVVYLM